jgi:molybdopterin/thiamine biosynthesis adenylyltransferase
MKTPSSERHGRQLQLAEIGELGQARIAGTHVAIVGCGGLGLPAAQSLVAAGIGSLTLIDHDSVELSNLGRQYLYRREDVGCAKAEVAAARLREIDPAVTIRPLLARVDTENAIRLIAHACLVLDCSDHFETRYAVHDAAHALGIPYIFGSAEGFSGQFSVFLRDRGPCLHCLFPRSQTVAIRESCETRGVLGPVPAVIGALQAAEALRWAVGLGESALGKVVLYDGRAARWNTIDLARDPECTFCNNTHPPSRSAPLVELQTLLAHPEDYTIFDQRPEATRALQPFPLPVQTWEQTGNPTAAAGTTAVFICQTGYRSAALAERFNGKTSAAFASLRGGWPQSEAPVPGPEPALSPIK